MTSRQRAILTGALYGFQCSCAACKPETNVGMLSDTRRRVIGHLVPWLDGHQPWDWTALNKLAGSVGHAPHLLSQEKRPLLKPLTQAQKVCYSFLLAHLREAEFGAHDQLAFAYRDAAWHLIEWLEAEPSVVSLQSVRNASEWMMKAVKVIEDIRADQDDILVVEMRRAMDECLNAETISKVLHMVSCSRFWFKLIRDRR